jgi:hypothetical protein
VNEREKRLLEVIGEDVAEEIKRRDSVGEIHLAGERPHESSAEPAQILYPFNR